MYLSTVKGLNTDFDIILYFKEIIVATVTFKRFVLYYSIFYVL